MEKYVVMVGLVLGAALVVPPILDRQTANLQSGGGSQSPQENAPLDAQPTSLNAQGHNPLDGRRAWIKADDRGHFVTQARMNGLTAEVLVDTGATAVAVNESMARRMGIRLSNQDFTIEVKTANGTTWAARGIIPYVEIGRVRVENVDALITRDTSLDGVLLGMSFLNKLSRFEISDGELTLHQ